MAGKNRADKSEPQREDAEFFIKQAGLRVTEIRKKILNALLVIKNPLSHADISALPGFSDLDRVTIYRNLWLLQTAGLLHAILGVDGVWRYCAHNPDQPGCPGNHPHFICQSCGTMICLTGQRLPTVEVPEGYSVTGKRFLVYGLCPECAKSEKNSVPKLVGK